MHQHHDTTPLPAGARRRAQLVLAAIVVPLFIATLVATWMLWPADRSAIGSRPLTDSNAKPIPAVVTERSAQADDALPTAGIRLEGGDNAGAETRMQVPPEIFDHGLDVGDKVLVVFLSDAMGSGSPYVFLDYQRTMPMGILFIGYLIVVALVARIKGLAAVVGLLTSLGVIVFFAIPAIMAGSNPVGVALTAGSLMMFCAVYLAHGMSIRTTTALLGTFGGLAITLGVGLWALRASHVTGAQGDTGQLISTMFPNLRLGDLILCGLVIACLGALNDVTITQASAVWELHAANPKLTKRELWRGGMRIGEDHIASTVYTLAFAYVGTALPLLILAALIDRSFLATLGAGEIAEEVVRTLVSSIGLILAIPLTTAIAVALVHKAPRRGLVKEEAAG